MRLTDRAARAIVRWDRERARMLGAAADDAPLFLTLSFVDSYVTAHHPVLRNVG